jgi:hypothetical protein
MTRASGARNKEIDRGRSSLASCSGLPSLSTGIMTTTDIMDLEILEHAMRVGFLCIS